jgi:hypothetical protein
MRSRIAQFRCGLAISACLDYSAGLLNYFFRGSLSAQSASGGGIAITNTSAENMNGTFSLYYRVAVCVMIMPSMPALYRAP